MMLGPHNEVAAYITLVAVVRRKATRNGASHLRRTDEEHTVGSH